MSGPFGLPFDIARVEGGPDGVRAHCGACAWSMDGPDAASVHGSLMAHLLADHLGFERPDLSDVADPFDRDAAQFSETLHGELVTSSDIDRTFRVAGMALGFVALLSFLVGWFARASRR